MCGHLGGENGWRTPYFANYSVSVGRSHTLRNPYLTTGLSPLSGAFLLLLFPLFRPAKAFKARSIADQGIREKRGGGKGKAMKPSHLSPDLPGQLEALLYKPLLAVEPLSLDGGGSLTTPPRFHRRVAINVDFRLWGGPAGTAVTPALASGSQA